MISDWRRYSQLWKTLSSCNSKRVQVRVMYRRSRSWPWCIDNEKNLDRARTDHNHNATMEKKVYSESKKGGKLHKRTWQCKPRIGYHKLQRLSKASRVEEGKAEYTTKMNFLTYRTTSMYECYCNQTTRQSRWKITMRIECTGYWENWEMDAGACNKVSNDNGKQINGVNVVSEEGKPKNEG